jgi:fructose-bisphosphate aldolase class II
MPIASFEQYCSMLERAKRGRFAYPAINVAGLEGLNAVLEGFAKARSDGILQVSSGGSAHASGPSVADMALGAQVLAEAAHRLAERFDVLIALHTDHCSPKNLKPFIDPLIEISEARAARGERPLFNSHMFDGSGSRWREPRDREAVPERLAAIDVILEIETAWWAARDGHDTSGTPREKLHHAGGHGHRHETLQPIGRFLLAATFGNVHGVTSRETWCSSRRSCATASSRCRRSTGPPRTPSTWSSTGARARPWRRSARRSSTAS